MHALQLQNIKREVAKKHDIQELNKNSVSQDNIYKKELKEPASEGEEDNEVVAHETTTGVVSSNIL